jgi:hypothetical protein
MDTTQTPDAPLQSTDKYTLLLSQALASVPKETECYGYLLTMQKRRRAGQGFSEAETTFLENAAKDPKAPCNPPNDTGVLIVAGAVLVVPLVLTGWYNAKKRK